MDQAKVQAIREWHTSTCLKDVQAALGFGNFYRRFFPNLAEVVKPLTDLTKKNEPFKWTRERQRAWEAFKNGFSTQPVFNYGNKADQPKLLLMLQMWLLEVFYSKSRIMVAGTLLCSDHRLCHLPSGTMQFMIEKCWPLSAL